MKQASVNSSIQFKPMNRQKIALQKQSASKPQSRMGHQESLKS